VTNRTPVSVHHGASRSSGNTRAEGLPVVTTSPASRASTRRAWRIAGLPKRQHADRGYLTHAQVAALADAVERDGTVVRFLAYTSLRWGEMAALRVQDFDMLRRRVNISRSVTESGGLVWSTPKSWERRSVPFPARWATSWRR